MATLTMSETEDCQRRFQAAVDVIQNLPKNGSYRPSYEVMLRFYGLYKQAVCGPCTASRPGFWDPVGRYKWDAWNQLGEISKEAAMAAYVDEMKKVAQEVIDTMPINEKTATFFRYFEPLYHVIHDMPRPPEALLHLTSEGSDSLTECEVNRPTEELILQQQDSTETVSVRDPQLENTALLLSEGQGPTSDSESEIFCDSVEQLDTVRLSAVSDVVQMGAGCGVEGADDRHDALMRPAASGCGSGEGGGEKVQQQIIQALRQLREDMQSVMERLEVVEGLATGNAQNSQWRSQLQLTAQETEKKWWPFDVSGHMLLLLLVWPFLTQGLMFLLRRRKRN